MTDQQIMPVAAPPERRLRGWKAVADELRQSPGQWFEVAQDVPKSMASYLRTRYDLDTRTEGRGSTPSRVQKLYARAHHTSNPGPAGTDLATAALITARSVVEYGEALRHALLESPLAQARDFADELDEFTTALDNLRAAFEIKE